MAQASIKMVGGGVIDNLNSMIEKGKSSKAFLARVAYPMYQARQMKRWITENASEGSHWKALNTNYKEWKRINYAGYPGNGEKMLIRTGALLGSVIGKELQGNPDETQVNEKGVTSFSGNLGSGKPKHFVMVTDTTLIVGTEVEYAKHVNSVRPMFTFKQEFYREIKEKYYKWFTKRD
jgi:hypothetical protein